MINLTNNLIRHGVFRSDNMMGTTVGTHLVSLRYDQDVDNGHVLAIGEFEDDSREVRIASAPTATTPKNRLAICGSEEIVKDVASHDIFEFYNKAGTLIRGYRFSQHDIFGVSKMCLVGDGVGAEVGQFAVITNGTRMQLSLAETGTVIGRVIAIDVESTGHEFVVIQVS